MALSGGHSAGSTGHIGDHNLIDTQLGAAVAGAAAGTAALAEQVTGRLADSALTAALSAGASSPRLALWVR
jgi:hypothetical protein